MANVIHPGDGSPAPDRGTVVSDGRTDLFTAPAYRDGTDLSAASARGRELMIGPMTFIVLVFVQATLLVVTAISLTLIVARPDIVQHLTGATGRIASATDRSVRQGLGTDSRDVKLNFTRPIQAIAGQPSVLDFRLSANELGDQSLILSIRGFPDGSVMRGITQLGRETWSIDARSPLAAVLTVPKSAFGPYDLSIEVKNVEGVVFYREDTSLIVRSLNRPTEDPEINSAAAAILLETGRSFIKEKNLNAGRLMLQKAAGRGSAVAAFELAQSHEAGKSDRDKQKALYWYLEASRLGHAESGDRFLNMLKRK
jgi:hypothetical protein